MSAHAKKKPHLNYRSIFVPSFQEGTRSVPRLGIIFSLVMPVNTFTDSV